MELPPFAPSQPGQSLVEAIYTTLRDAIIRGDLPAGQRLREIPLATHFDVSTTPVRSALQRLDFEGLVDISPRRGAVVAITDRGELKDLYELRELLECHAVAAGMKKGDHDLALLEDILRRADEALKSGNQARFNELDLEFHYCLTELGGNDELRNVAQQTHRRIQAVRTRHAVGLPDQPPVSQQEHASILDAVRVGDRKTAVELLRHHISSVGEAVREAVKSSEQPEDVPAG